MSETPAPASVTTYADAERALLARWPETRLEPSLDRIEAFVELLGEPQRGYPVIQLTGTNGKTSTSRMIDALITATGLRTGRFTSPHVESMTERISLDGEPLSEEQFLEAYQDVAPLADLADRDAEHPLSFFETLVGMAYAAWSTAIGKITATVASATLVASHEPPMPTSTTAASTGAFANVAKAIPTTISKNDSGWTASSSASRASAATSL